MDLSWLVGIVTTALAAGVGAYVSARLGVVHAERAESNRLRRRTAEEIIGALTKLRELLRDVQNDRSLEQWTVPVITAYDTIDNARFRLPDLHRELPLSGRTLGGWMQAESVRPAR